MTYFNTYDHDDALQACWDARNLGVELPDNIANTLNIAAGAHACNESSSLSRADFESALRAAREIVDAAKAAAPAVEIRAGQKVVHKTFGNGTVLATEDRAGMACAQVKFIVGGTKWLSLSQANLTVDQQAQ